MLDCVANGSSKEEAAAHDAVGVSTVYLWCQTPEKVTADKPGPKGRHKLDLERLATMIGERPTAYPSELAVPLGVSEATVCRGLKALQITRKKNHNVPRKRRQA